MHASKHSPGPLKVTPTLNVACIDVVSPKHHQSECLVNTNGLSPPHTPTPLAQLQQRKRPKVKKKKSIIFFHTLTLFSVKWQLIECFLKVESSTKLNTHHEVAHTFKSAFDSKYTLKVSMSMEHCIVRFKWHFKHVKSI